MLEICRQAYHFLAAHWPDSTGKLSIEARNATQSQPYRAACRVLRSVMPDDFANDIHKSIAAAIAKRLPHLASALDDL